MTDWGAYLHLRHPRPRLRHPRCKAEVHAWMIVFLDFRLRENDGMGTFPAPVQPVPRLRHPRCKEGGSSKGLSGNYGVLAKRNPPL